MQNAWDVHFVHQGKRKFKTFEGEKPIESGAIAFGKKLQERGIKILGICSRRKGFNKPPKVIIPQGLLWCPYCLKAREFTERRVRHPNYVSTLEWRCVVCKISINDAYVKKNNPMMVAILDARNRTRVPSEKAIRKATRR